MKKIYVVTTTVPGNVGGSQIRNYNLIKQLKKKKDHDVRVFSISSTDAEIARKEITDVSRDYTISKGVPRSPSTMLRSILLESVPPDMTESKLSGMGETFRKACEGSMPDIVWIEAIHGYYCIREHILWLKKSGVKIVFDCHNIEVEAFESSTELLSPFKKIIAGSLIPRLRELEVEATERADLVFACSQNDADFFKKYNPETYVVPNGVDCKEFKPSRKKKKGNALIFMGGVKYSPNADGLKFYLKEVYPEIKKKVPEVELMAIGADREWAHANGIKDVSVEPLGFVPSITPYLDAASIGICPIRRGGGTRIKILTYMAAGLPVVSTTKGAEGVDYMNGRDIILADDPKIFAEAVVRLLNDSSYYKKIRDNGRKFVAKNYDWDVIGMKLIKILNGISSEKH